MLEIKNVSKNFGSVKALNDVSFTINAGDLFGVIGQNGAGKSTLFRSIMNFYDFKGEILYNGMKMSKVPLEKIGFLPEERSLSPKKSIKEEIEYFAKLNQMKNINDEIIEKWFNKFEIKGKPTDKIKTLSKGNQQKVQLLCALIYNPEFVILDEPFSGLDPYNITLLEDIIKELNANGTTIVFSSHNMSNVESLCNRILMLKDGEIALYGTPLEVRNQFKANKITIETDKDLSFLTEKYPRYDHYRDTWNFYPEEVKDGEDIFREISEKIGYVKYFSQTPPTLHEIFTRTVEQE